MFRRRHGRSDRHQDLNGRTGSTKKEEEDKQAPAVRREDGGDRHDQCRDEHAQDQPAVLDKICERHEEEQAGGITQQ